MAVAQQERDSEPVSPCSVGGKPGEERKSEAQNPPSDNPAYRCAVSKAPVAQYIELSDAFDAFDAKSVDRRYFSPASPTETETSLESAATEQVEREERGREPGFEASMEGTVARTLGGANKWCRCFGQARRHNVSSCVCTASGMAYHRAISRLPQ